MTKMRHWRRFVVNVYLYNNLYMAFLFFYISISKLSMMLFCGKEKLSLCNM